jgi:hypothetical protein
LAKGAIRRGDVARDVDEPLPEYDPHNRDGW